MTTGPDSKLVKIWYFPTALPQKLIKNVQSINLSEVALQVVFRSAESGQLHTYGCPLAKVVNWEIEPDLGQNTRSRA